MKKFIPAITLIALIGIEAQLEAAWPSKRRASMEAEQANSPGFYVHDTRIVYAEVDYLFWRPQFEDTSFVMKNKGNTEQNQSFSLKQPNYDISSGVRVGIGGYTEDSWDIGVRATYLYSDATKHTSGHLDKNTKTYPQWTPTLFGTGGSKATANWRLNLFVLDFTIGREYFLIERFSIHPFIGLRGFQINQNMKDRYRGLFGIVLPASTLSGQFKAEQDIRGVGPRLGLDLNFYMTKSWALMGGLSGSLLYSRYHVTQNSKGHLYNDITTLIDPVNVRLKDKASFGRANLDTYFGIGWDHWFKNGDNRIAVSVLFEASHWFQINQLVDMDVKSLNDATNQATKRHGDLSFVGGTIHFQYDF